MLRRTLLLGTLLGALTFSATALAEKRPWPVNGRVINTSTATITVWSDDRGLYTIAPKARSDARNDDVDYVRDVHGQWWKVGPRTVLINHGGNVRNAECSVSQPGKRCGQ
jgi:hypothetical protein